jgi:hypothetical protein
MGFAAKPLPEGLVQAPVSPRLVLVRGGVPCNPEHSPAEVVRQNSLSRELAVLCLILVALQFADFALTALGVSHFGIEAEGNPLIRGLMYEWGAMPALLGVKLLATLIIYVLYVLARQVSWLRIALRCVIAIYLFAAIIPWTGILIGTLAG